LEIRRLEKYHPDVVLVLGWFYGSAKGVTGFPEDGVNFVLGDGGGEGMEELDIVE
jgi:hypothetical protein